MACCTHTRISLTHTHADRNFEYLCVCVCVCLSLSLSLSLLLTFSLCILHSLRLFSHTHTHSEVRGSRTEWVGRLGSEEPNTQRVAKDSENRGDKPADQGREKGATACQEWVWVNTPVLFVFSPTRCMDSATCDAFEYNSAPTGGEVACTHIDTDISGSNFATSGTKGVWEAQP